MAKELEIGRETLNEHVGLFELNPHIRAILRKKPFPCTRCSRFFATELGLGCHAKYHREGTLRRRLEAPRPFTCLEPGCAQRYMSKGALTKHRREKHPAVAESADPLG